MPEIFNKMPCLIHFPSNGWDPTCPRMHWARYRLRPLPGHLHWQGLHQLAWSLVSRLAWLWEAGKTKQISQEFSTAHVLLLYIAMVTTCIVLECTAKSRKGKGKMKVHTLPKDINRGKQWLRAINNPKHPESSVMENVNLQVCSLHFKNEDDKPEKDLSMGSYWK